MQKQNYKLRVKEILDVTEGKLIIGNEETVFENFCKDTREIKPNDVYLGIKGEKNKYYWKNIVFYT